MKVFRWASFWVVCLVLGVGLTFVSLRYTSFEPNEFSVPDAAGRRPILVLPGPEIQMQVGPDSGRLCMGMTFGDTLQGFPAAVVTGSPGGGCGPQSQPVSVVGFLFNVTIYALLCAVLLRFVARQRPSRVKRAKQ